MNRPKIIAKTFHVAISFDRDDDRDRGVQYRRDAGRFGSGISELRRSCILVTSTPLIKRAYGLTNAAAMSKDTACDEGRLTAVSLSA